ncbi:MAG: glycosyltransferase family 2 protein [Chitinophagaceae bacterium]|nr:glycosyltransferase family 2 protein [Chitinophagaceae bacterium]
MRLSVIIPVYNGAETICRAVDSVMAQGHHDLEVIVVDDASTDATFHLVKQQYGDNVQLISLPKNSGSSFARNAGMAVATGDYIAFLDADDSWGQGKIEAITEVLRNRPEIAFLYHGYSLAPMDKPGKDLDLYPRKLSYVRLLAGNVISTSCVVLKNERHFRFATDMRYCEDYELWLRISYRCGAYYLDFPFTRLYRPITSVGGISANRLAMRIGEMRAYARLPRLNPFFLFLVPLLWMGSATKHVLKLLRLL